MTRIRLTVKSTDLGFQGCISFYDDKLHLWTQSSGIDRLNREDAFLDAKIMANDVGIEVSK